MNLRSLSLLSLLSIVPALLLAQVGTPIAGTQTGQIELAADPVDLGTGIYFREYVDLFESDTIPIDFRRTQRTMDHRIRTFGLGAMTSYDMWIIGDAETWSWVGLVMADGSQERFERVTPGTSMRDAIFRDNSSPTIFNGARVGRGAIGR